MNGYIKINPNDFTENQLPIIIVAEDRQGMFGWAIKWHSKDNYNHVEVMVHLGKVATQNPGGFKEVPISKIMTKQAFLKFWQFDPVDRTEIGNIIKLVEQELAKPPQYDFLGLIGQLTGLRWIQNPWKEYCSEGVAMFFRTIKRLLGIIPPRPNPSELNQIFKTMPDMKLLGYWWYD